MERKIPIEILCDAETPNIDTAPAIEAVDFINNLVGDPLEVVRYSQTVQLTKESHPIIRSSEVIWPREAIILKLVLTKRDLAVDERYDILGYTNRYDLSSSGVSVVNTNDMNIVTPQFTITHELGHLFGLRYSPQGDRQHDTKHCHDRDCIMYHRAQESAALIEEAFCDSCHTQLAKRAFYMCKFRSNYPVKPELR